MNLISCHYCGKEMDGDEELNFLLILSHDLPDVREDLEDELGYCCEACWLNQETRCKEVSPGDGLQCGLREGHECRHLCKRVIVVYWEQDMREETIETEEIFILCPVCGRAGEAECVELHGHQVVEQR